MGSTGMADNRGASQVGRLHIDAATVKARIASNLFGEFTGVPSTDWLI